MSSHERQLTDLRLSSYTLRWDRWPIRALEWEGEGEGVFYSLSYPIIRYSVLLTELSHYSI